MSSLSTVSERLKIARIAARPAAGPSGQVHDSEVPVDRLLIGEIGRERECLGGGGIRPVSIRHYWALKNRKGLAATPRGDSLKWAPETRFSREGEKVRFVAARQTSAFSGQSAIYRASDPALPPRSYRPSGAKPKRATPFDDQRPP